MEKQMITNTKSSEEPWPIPFASSWPTAVVPHAEVLTAPNPATATEVMPDLVIDRTPVDNTAPLYKVLIHNDDVTPLDYVIRILRRVFTLSDELAEHIAETAHNEEVAIVVVRPRTEAEKLLGAARLQARADGFPLTFSMEPDE